MVHVLAPRPPHPNLPMFFNVDAAVGPAPASNIPEDVALVQFLLRLIGDNPGGMGTGVSDVLKQVTPTGVMDEKTLAAIKAVQVLEKKPTDGRVSSAQGYKYGATFYTIVDLNFSIRDRAKFHGLWPNLDKIGGCPPTLQAAIRRAMVGQSPPR